MFKKLTVLFLVSVSLTASADAIAESPFSSVKDFLKPANIKTKVKDEVADLSIGASGTLLDADLAGAINFSTRYRYEVEPSHNKGFYTRVDGWKVKTSLRPGDLIGGLSTPLFFSIDRGASVYFVRQFKKQKDALKAKPYSFLRLPLTAKIAKEKLEPGDLVQIPTNMSLAFGAGTGRAYPNVDAGVRVIKALSGSFYINVFRMKDNHARVRIISKRVNRLGGGIGAGLEFNIFGVRIVDNLVEKLIETDLAKFDLSKHQGEQFIVDYVFDLDTAEGEKAYNEILSGAYKFNDVEIMKEFVKKNGLENRLVHVFELSEELAHEDLNKEEKRTERLFKGFNQFKGNNRGLKLGAIITSFGKGTTYRMNLLAEEKMDGSVDKYFYHTLTSNRSRNFGLSGFGLKEKANQTVLAMYPEKIATSKVDMPDIGFIFNISDSILRVREQKYLNRDLKMNLPKYAKDILEWNIGDSPLRTARANFEVYINGSVLSSIKKISKDEIYERLTKLWKQYEREGKSFGEIAGEVTTDTITFRNVNQYAEKKRAARLLHKALFKQNTVEERVAYIMDLRKNNVFKRVGFSVIMSMLSEKQQQEFTYTKLKITSKKSDSVYFEEGETNTPNVYKELRNLQNVMDGNGYSVYF